MSIYLLETTNNIEHILSNVQGVTVSGGRVILKDASQFTNKPIVIADAPLPFEFQTQALITTDFENVSRKLGYFCSCGIDTLCVIPEYGFALLGSIESAPPAQDVNRLNLMPVPLRFVGVGTVVGYAKEAEDCTLTGSVTIANSDYSGGYCAGVQNQNETVDFNITASPWALPIGDYTWYIRGSQAATEASSVTISVYNVTDSASVATSTTTFPSPSIGWISLNFSIASGQVNDNLRFRILKVNNTGMTLYPDLSAVVMRN